MQENDFIHKMQIDCRLYETLKVDWNDLTDVFLLFFVSCSTLSSYTVRFDEKLCDVLVGFRLVFELCHDFC